VFGTVINGWDVVKLIESYGTNSGKPAASIKITSAGVLENDDEVDGQSPNGHLSSKIN
jgi:hypothetical protein